MVMVVAGGPNFMLKLHGAKLHLPVSSALGMKARPTLEPDRSYHAGPPHTARLPATHSATLTSSTARLTALQRMAHTGARTLPAVMQLKSPQERRDAEQGFLDNHHKLFLGQVVGGRIGDANGNALATLTAGAFVIYSGAIRDNFTYKDSGHTIEQDRVFGAVVTNAAGQLKNRAEWVTGWIKYGDIKPDYVASQALQTRERAVSGGATVFAALNAIAQNGTLHFADHRTSQAPKAIRAWVEHQATGENGETALAAFETRMPLSHGNDALQTEAANGADAILDPQHELGLSKLSVQADPNSFYAKFVAYLAENANALPGTMAKDHEMRSTWTGGPRASQGQDWLKSFGRQLNNEKVVAITGSQIVNIFVNRAAPTWSSYEANYQHHMQSKGFQVKNTDWTVAALRGDDDAIQRIHDLTQPRPGEMYLFHGTSRESVFNIAKTGFDPEFGNFSFAKGYGKTGYGSDFTDQFAKALAYAEPTKVSQDQNAQSRKYVIVARVFVGHSHDAGDQARRTRGNLEMTQDNLNYEQSRGNKPKAQGIGQRWLGQASETVAASYNSGDPLHSTLQHRVFDLSLDAEQGQGLLAMHRQFRDTSVVISDAIQIYPAYIIEATVPTQYVRKGRRTLVG